MTWPDLLSLIESNDSFLISSHVNPDGDCIGSQLAFKWYLDSLGKNAVIYDHHPVPEKFRFLTGSDSVTTKEPANTFDVLVVLDSSNPGRLGWKNYTDKSAKVMNIDHHQDNSRFADVNIVDSSASSTGEIIFRFFQDHAIDFPQHVAIALYTAIMTDTGGFRFSNTNGNVLRICADLADRGADCADAYKRAYASHSPRGELLRARIFATTAFYLDDRVCAMTFPLKMITEIGANYGDSEGMADHTITATGVEVGMLIKHNDKETHFSLRSVGNADVGRIAKNMGGGGHKSAAGCTINAPCKEATATVLEAIEAELEG